MQFVFLGMDGKTLFIRDDAERAQWTQEEMTLDLDFPFLPDKIISIGQRIFFKDPATGAHQIYEVKQAKTFQLDAYQQVTAEHICISELSDEHVDNTELTGIPPQTALSIILTGTLWGLGNVEVGNLAAQQRIRNEVANLGLNGNVDLTSRPIIYPDKMKAAGYTDFDGDYATLYSTTYTQELAGGEMFTLLMTPIQTDSYVLSYEQLDAYVDSLCESSSTGEEFKANDFRGLLMHYLPGEQVATMDAIAETAHDLSDEWETVNNGVLASADISRGSVWQGVLQIKDNWNVYIEPRIALESDGTIHRMLDIKTTDGVWNGMRLSIDKNLLDPSVTFDDSEVVTALYGYGGTVEDKKDPERPEETTFADIVWAAEDGHPAKPKGQKYLEDPAATAEFGRDGRARFGYFQNNDITDPEILLEKTWETLQTTNSPAISIEGTVADLYRMGYADEPLKLHDIALVEILPSGFKKQIQIIRMTVDLLDPTATSLTIGDYIPNIIYINRKTDENATGSRGGGGGNKAKDTNTWQEFKTTIQAYQDGTGMIIKAVQNDNTKQDKELAIQKAEIEVTYSMIRMEVQDRRDADNQLGSRITQTASQIRAEVYATSSDIYKNIGSSITQTASQIRAEVWSNASTTYSFIEQTASQIRSEVVNVNSEVYSTIEQTASQIRTEVNDLSSGVYSSITETASQIRSEVNASSSTLYSAITQTATQIRSEVASTASGLSSSITQNADKIAIVVNSDNSVNAASIVAGINSQDKTSSSYVNISADYINLTGYVTATQLSAVSASIDNLKSGQTQAEKLLSKNVTTNTLVVGGSTFAPSNVTFKGSDGTNVTLKFLIGS